MATCITPYTHRIDANTHAYVILLLYYFNKINNLYNWLISFNEHAHYNIFIILSLYNIWLFYNKSSEYSLYLFYYEFVSVCDDSLLLQHSLYTPLFCNVLLADSIFVSLISLLLLLLQLWLKGEGRGWKWKENEEMNG